MADGIQTLPTTSSFEVLERLAGHFAYMPDAVLEAVAGGRPAGFVTAGLARTLLETRQHLSAVRT